MTAFLLILLAFLMLSSVPIFMCLVTPVAISFALFSEIDLFVIIQTMLGGIDKFSLISVPFFILAANLMGEGGISKRLIRLSGVFMGRIPGGLGITTIVTCLFFGAISGSSPATVAAVGSIMYPALREKGYPKSYCLGMLASAGSLGIIIPPSVTMIFYGTVTGVSVGTLFMTGIGAGLVYAGLFIVYTVYVALKHPEIEREEKTTLHEKLVAIWKSVPGLGVPFIILGGIYGGFFTPTEASAISVLYAIVIVLFVYREMTIKQVIDCIYRSAVVCVQLMILTAGAAVFAWFLTFTGITASLAKSAIALSSNKYVILLLINFIVLIAGMFLDGASIMTILAPLFYPIALSVGIDPIHLGIIIVVNCAIGMYTPPFGQNLFVSTGIAKESITTIARHAIPFIILAIVALMLVTYIPDISLWLPKQLYGAW